ncbi:MAG: ABC transporter permease [Sneathiella sp.]|uniref:ABC transporter permease n=1 Tax=Sneathiella sp. TaxID=1964365 RepID=UPI003001702F
MADRNSNRRAPAAALEIKDLHVYYGQSHALQGVNLSLDHGVHSVVGRNGMGKTTLCNSIMGLLPARRGSIKYHGEEISGMPPYKIANKGIGYTPQGRRLWPSLSVDEHMQLSDKGGSWNIERIYETFPRLYERRRNGAGQLSGGEQQMLAISRALLQDPQLLILDEPTEGLAPVIVSQLERLLADLASDSDVAILLIEQNIAVATAISENVAIMVNGRISRVIPSQQLASDRPLQERLLGVGRHSHEDVELPEPVSQEVSVPAEVEAPAQDEETSDTVEKIRVYQPPTRWSKDGWKETTVTEKNEEKPPLPFDAIPTPMFREPRISRDTSSSNEVYVVGTFDTKRLELGFIRDEIARHDITVKTIDVSTSQKPSSADVPPHLIAAFHPGGTNAVFLDDRGKAVEAMALAFENWIVRQGGVGGIISAGGSGGTSLATPAMRQLPIGVPKVMISTVASGEVGHYVGPTDIMMMYSVTDVQGLNKISRQVLANGANAMVGMFQDRQKSPRYAEELDDKPGLGLTMFGVTTQAVQQLTAALDPIYECLVFHATGTGGRSMEKLADSGLIEAAIDLTTTEVCDMMMGGVFPSNEDRFGAFIRTSIPWVGSVGALDMVNFGARNTVPEKYSSRLFVEHNPSVTLMRTTAEENTRMGEWIADRINQMNGPVRFVIPEGGVSALDAPGQPFHDPAADKALFDALRSRIQETSNRRVIVSPHNINDPAFTEVVEIALEEISTTTRSKRHVAY